VATAAAASTRRPIEPLLPRHLSERRRAGVADAVARGLQVPMDQQPQIPQRMSRRATDAEHKRFLEFQKRRDARAQELGIDPTLMGSRATRAELGRSWEKHAGDLMNWQRELLRP